MYVCACKLTDLAALAGAAPGRSQCGAALRLQCGSVDIDLAAVVLHRQPAGTLHTVCGDQGNESEHFMTETRCAFLHTQSTPREMIPCASLRPMKCVGSCSLLINC